MKLHNLEIKNKDKAACRMKRDPALKKDFRDRSSFLVWRI